MKKQGRTWFLVSNANQSPVPVGKSPIDRHFHSPNASVSTLQRKYTNFCRASVVRALGSGACFLPAGTGANGAKARCSTYKRDQFMRAQVIRSREDVPLLIPARFLNGLSSNMNTIPMLNICTPPPDMYSMNACIGNDFAGEMARSHARLSFMAS